MDQVHVAPWDRFVPSEKIIVCAERSYSQRTRNANVSEEERARIKKGIVKSLWVYCADVVKRLPLHGAHPLTTAAGELVDEFNWSLAIRVHRLDDDEKIFSTEFANILVSLAQAGTYCSCTMQLEIVDGCVVLRRTL